MTSSALLIVFLTFKLIMMNHEDYKEKAFTEGFSQKVQPLACSQNASKS